MAKKTSNWEKVPKPPRLGRDQAGMLKSIKQHGSFYHGCGWTWGTASLGQRVLDSLEKKGLVVRLARSPLLTVYKLHPRAEELFEKAEGSRWWKYKDGAIQEIKRRTTT